jgi:hypothetical protein
MRRSRAEIYLATFPEMGLLKVGKATPWTVRSRVKDAADKLRIRQTENGAERPITCKAVAWAIRLFGDENVVWAVSERVEHSAAGRLAYNVGATSVPHTEGKEWLRHNSIESVDWARRVSSRRTRDARFSRSRRRHRRPDTAPGLADAW